ncbi:MAG TPA: hypothetical protein VHB21_11335, partial [Minicystis sp.]|nr:hypothetical protein [Minicystis sp.]
MDALSCFQASAATPSTGTVRQGLMRTVDRAELERALPPGCVLVEPRVLRRVIKRDRRVPGLGLDVPHGSSYVVARAALVEAATAEELGGRTAADLPDPVVLLPRPDADDGRGDAELLRELWRRAFHASVHAALEARTASGDLPAAAIRERIHRLGRAEFDEVRLVLRQERRLYAGRDEREAWIEFAATFLELRAFEPELVPRVFPVLVDEAAV